MNSFFNFVFQTAAVDVDIIKTCPTKNKIAYFCVGMSVLITSVFAFLSGSYALYIASKSWKIAILGGSLWAFFVYNLDRLI